jgi:hypothetical protein
MNGPGGVRQCGSQSSISGLCQDLQGLQYQPGAWTSTSTSLKSLLEIQNLDSTDPESSFSQGLCEIISMKKFEKPFQFLNSFPHLSSFTLFQGKEKRASWVFW